jgi:hypothetical protein
VYHSHRYITIFSVACARHFFLWGHAVSPPKKTPPPLYSWNIVVSGVKHHKPNQTLGLHGFQPLLQTSEKINRQFISMIDCLYSFALQILITPLVSSKSSLNFYGNFDIFWGDFLSVPWMVTFPILCILRTPFRRGVLDTTLCDKVFQWLAADQ